MMVWAWQNITSTNQTKKGKDWELRFEDTGRDSSHCPERNSLKPNAVRRTLPQNYYREVKKTKIEFTMSSIIWTGTENVPEDYKEISFGLLKTGCGSLETAKHVRNCLQEDVWETGWI